MKQLASIKMKLHISTGKFKLKVKIYFNLRDLQQEH